MGPLSALLLHHLFHSDRLPIQPRAGQQLPVVVHAHDESKREQLGHRQDHLNRSAMRSTCHLPLLGWEDHDIARNEWRCYGCHCAYERSHECMSKQCTTATPAHPSTCLRFAIQQPQAVIAAEHSAPRGATQQPSKWRRSATHALASRLPDPRDQRWVSNSVLLPRRHTIQQMQLVPCAASGRAKQSVASCSGSPRASTTMSRWKITAAHVHCTSFCLWRDACRPGLRWLGLGIYNPRYGNRTAAALHIEAASRQGGTSPHRCVRAISSCIAYF